ncbi:MAG: hypothetical protein ACRDFQ_01175 [Anaerolineales bacterium]
MKRFVFVLILGLFLVSCAPQPTPEPLGAEVYITSSELLVAESYPVQVRLHVVGDLPTPCHTFAAEVSGPDGENRIDVSAYSIGDPLAICVQVLEPFDETVAIPITGAADGTYSVWLNGEFVGEFSYPA